LRKGQFCKDNNIDRKELKNYVHEYLSSRLHAKASLFSLGNAMLLFENEVLNADNYDHTIMMDDDIIEFHSSYSPAILSDKDVILEMLCGKQKFLRQEAHWLKINSKS